MIYATQSSFSEPSLSPTVMLNSCYDYFSVTGKRQEDRLARALGPIRDGLNKIVHDTCDARVDLLHT